MLDDSFDKKHFNFFIKCVKSVGSCYLFNMSSHRHTVGKRTRELFQVCIGYITSSSSRCLRCIEVVVFYRRGDRRRMQLLLVMGDISITMHCNMRLLELDCMILYLYISIYFIYQFFVFVIIIRRFPRLSFGMHSLGENNGNPNTDHSIYSLECVHPV